MLEYFIRSTVDDKSGYLTYGLLFEACIGLAVSFKSLKQAQMLVKSIINPMSSILASPFTPDIKITGDNSAILTVELLAIDVKYNRHYKQLKVVDVISKPCELIVPEIDMSNSYRVITVLMNDAVLYVTADGLSTDIEKAFRFLRDYRDNLMHFCQPIINKLSDNGVGPDGLVVKVIEVVDNIPVYDLYIGPTRFK